MCFQSCFEKKKEIFFVICVRMIKKISHEKTYFSTFFFVFLRVTKNTKFS